VIKLETFETQTCGRLLMKEISKEDVLIISEEGVSGYVSKASSSVATFNFLLGLA
jgi:hypothetical protein